jgi:hypothetical protein
MRGRRRTLLDPRGHVKEILKGRQVALLRVFSVISNGESFVGNSKSRKPTEYGVHVLLLASAVELVRDIHLQCQPCHTVTGMTIDLLWARSPMTPGKRELDVGRAKAAVSWVTPRVPERHQRTRQLAGRRQDGVILREDHSVLGANVTHRIFVGDPLTGILPIGQRPRVDDMRARRSPRRDAGAQDRDR